MGPNTTVTLLAHALRVDVTGMLTLSLCCDEITAVKRGSLAVGATWIGNR
jgi:hypothetical protein